MDATRRRLATAEGSLRAELAAVQTALADVRAAAPAMPHLSASSAAAYPPNPPLTGFPPLGSPAQGKCAVCASCVAEIACGGVMVEHALLWPFCR